MDREISKRHQIAGTSLACYRNIKDTDLFTNQRAKVMQAIKKANKAIDYKGLALDTKIEPTSVGRVLSQLITLGVIKEAYRVGQRRYFIPVVD